MRSRLTQGLLLVVLTAVAVVVWTGATSAAPGPPTPPAPPTPSSSGPGPGHNLYVSNTAGGDASTPGPATAGGDAAAADAADTDAAANVSPRGCNGASYTTIGDAVNAAQSGDTIVVCPGVYAEDVVVPAGKSLSLRGIGNPIVNATGDDNGIQVLASNSTVDGFTVGYANGEGILVGPRIGSDDPTAEISNVTISHNTVVGNDQGNPSAQTITSSSYAQCNGSQAGPGDCGEGIHLLAVEGSTVANNDVTGNDGGILLTDESGPTDGNTISGNDVSNNVYDCGITIAGHHVGVFNTTTHQWATVLPTVGGVFDNTVKNNVTNSNGVLGQGGGILLATGAPGGAVDDNTIRGNSAAGNGLAGITVHSHSPGENLNGNVLKDNTLGVNNIDGDPDFGGNTPPAIDPSTTGILVATAVSPISITIKHNTIEFDTYGIWITPLVTVDSSGPPNTFIGVTTPTFTAP